jgi:hypothetical protein
MANLISSEEQAGLTGIYGDFFDTFKETIIIYKEPTRVISEINTSQLFGYGEVTNLANYEYIPNSGVFEGLVRYSKDVAEFENAEEFGLTSPTSEISIKIEKDAKDFIATGGKVEKVIIGNQTYKIISDFLEDGFLSKDYYTYELEMVK